MVVDGDRITAIGDVEPGAADRGVELLAALDLQQKLRRIGYQANAWTDAHSPTRKTES